MAAGVCPLCQERGHADPEPGGPDLTRSYATMTGARALVILDGQYDDRANAEQRTRERYRRADEVTGPDEALRWLKDHARIEHRYPS